MFLNIVLKKLTLYFSLVDILIVMLYNGNIVRIGGVYEKYIDFFKKVFWK